MQFGIRDATAITSGLGYRIRPPDLFAGRVDELTLKRFHKKYNMREARPFE